MKKKQASNVFTIPNWMRNLKAKEPEGTYTPEEVAAALEMNILFNGDAASLKGSVESLVPKVPLKQQKLLKAFLAVDDEAMLQNVTAFINKVNSMLAPVINEVVDERSSEEVATNPSRGSDQHCVPEDWGDDWDRPSGSRSGTRGHRAVRAAKRQQTDS